jgi:hypothetical protein
MPHSLPPHLAEALKQRRVIPFVGAGFSRDLGLPDWATLIGTVAEELDMDAEICALYGDFLQIAEYYVTKHGIGGPS